MRAQGQGMRRTAAHVSACSFLAGLVDKGRSQARSSPAPSTGMASFSFPAPNRAQGQQPVSDEAC